MRIVEENLTKNNLLKIIEIDKKFYKEDILSVDWYLERYNEKHKVSFLLDNENVVGYLVSVPINKKLYETIINGVLINDLYVNPDMFVEKSDYNYIVSCVILEKYRSNGYGSLMMKKLFEKTKGKFCVLTITEEGYNLAKKFCTLTLKIKDNISVFEKEVK